MTDIAEICAGLTDKQRGAVINGRVQWRSMPVHHWSVYRRLCAPTKRRPALFEEGQVGLVVMFRLTTIGYSCQHLIQFVQHDAEEPRP
ncbi:MAG: hypothetical protein EOO77_03825 [Oxalobacteraceae bacterium]|nr:MAG: hypothetical protein EOO77_03825 [Oxalobacteraceae bacterium]